VLPLIACIVPLLVTLPVKFILLSQVTSTVPPASTTTLLLTVPQPLKVALLRTSRLLAKEWTPPLI